MGLIKATMDSVSGVFGDQWKEYFYCDSLPSTVLIKKGLSTGTTHEDNIIANGSIIAVNHGQCALIIEDGEIIDIVSEPGQFIWDSSTSPCIFTGNLKDSVRESFREVYKRVQFHGTTAKDQRIYFINLKLIENNLFGTQSPIAFRFVDISINADFDLHIQCRGRFSYQIIDPIKFYSNIAGNVEDVYHSNDIFEQLRAEFMNSFGISLSSISSIGMRPSELLKYTNVIVNEMNSNMRESWANLRGIKLISIAFESINLPDEEQKMLTNLQEKRAYSAHDVALGHFNQARGDALKMAASNENGNILAFAGIDIAMNRGQELTHSLVSNQDSKNNSIELRIQRLNLLKGKISQEVYDKKLDEILSEI
ncbi:TPA: SPFH domain-containing protein [Streptococcus suis]